MTDNPIDVDQMMTPEEIERAASKILYSDVCEVKLVGSLCDAARLARDLADQLEVMRERIAELEAWNAEMVEKAASGGTLEGYREMGQRIAELEVVRGYYAQRGQRQRKALEAVKAGLRDDLVWSLLIEHPTNPKLAKSVGCIIDDALASHPADDDAGAFVTQVQTDLLNQLHRWNLVHLEDDCDLFDFAAEAGLTIDPVPFGDENK